MFSGISETDPRTRKNKDETSPYLRAIPLKPKVMAYSCQVVARHASADTPRTAEITGKTRVKEVMKEVRAEVKKLTSKAGSAASGSGKSEGKGVTSSERVDGESGLIEGRD